MKEYIAMRGSPYLLPAALASFIACGICVIYLQLGIEQIDAFFFPDDTYYTLSIARNIVAGIGPSADGVVLTSGFQPLIALLMLPVLMIVQTPDLQVMGVAIVSAGFFVLSIGLFALLVGRLTGSRIAALLSATFAASSPVLVSNGLNGLETSLTAAIQLGFLLGVQGSDRSSQTARLIGIGMLGGLALLARIDSIFLLLASLVWGLQQIGLRRSLIVVGSAALTALPWVLYCQINFGYPVPESGAAVRQLALYQISVGNTDLIRSFRPFFEFSTLGIALLSFAAFGIAALLEPFLSLRRRKWDLRTTLAVSAWAQFAFYMLYLPAYWFFDRYFNMLFFSCLALVAAQLTALLNRSNRELGGRMLPATLMFAILAGGNVVAHREQYGPDVPAPIDHGYASKAAELLALLPDGTVLASMQTGALAWQAQIPEAQTRQLRVINLDGVVNGEARDAISSHQLAAYVRQQNATHFADWASLAQMTNHFSGLDDSQLIGDALHMAEWGGFNLYPVLHGEAQD